MGDALPCLRGVNSLQQEIVRLPIILNTCWMFVLILGAILAEANYNKSLRLRLALALTTSVACLAPLTAAAGPRPPAEAFAALPKYSNIAISPDGKNLAFGVPRADGDIDLQIFNLETGRSSGVGMGKVKLRAVRFEDGGQILATASITQEAFGTLREWYRVFAIDTAQKNARNLLTQGGVGREYNTGVNLVSLLPDAGNSIIMSTYDVISSNSGATLNLYKVALNSNAVEVVARGTVHTVDWLTDNQGVPVARVDLNLIGKHTTLWLKGEGREWREGLKIEDTGTSAISLYGFSARGNILFRRWTDSQFGELEAINPTTGQISTLLKADGVELSSVSIDSFSQQLMGVSVGGLNPDIRWTNSELLEAQAQLEAQFPNKIVSIQDYTPDRKKLVAMVETTSEPPAYYLLDMTTPSIKMIGPSMPSLKDIPLGQVRATTFKSRDGVDIPVYVTTPPGHNDAKNAPTIIFPHGGPASRDEPRFNWWAQFMATRGYVVIQPQFRGSTGFGREFEEAGFRQWGKRMQDDVTDAVGWAVKEGITDASRTCIVGASYGGYAALAGATMTPDLYKCAVSVAGVSDLPQMMRDERSDVGGERSSTVNYWAGHIGSDDRVSMEAASPRRLADAVRAPILLIHGKDDTVVKFNQSTIMATALRRANKPFKLVELAAEDHWLSRAATRLQMLREIEAFLTENLGPGLE
jgi:dipeptidyl aminopeptidase/acylaminoacyl peptidase